MEVTRRYKGGVMLVSLLAGGAWLLKQPLLLVGATSIGASLLVQQYRFLRAVLKTTDDLTLTQSASQNRVTTNDETSVVLRATLTQSTPLSVVIEAQPPVTATSRDLERHQLKFSDGAQRATTTFPLRWPVAGQFECASPTVTLTDRAGFFHSTVELGPTETVTVVPRRPRNLHVGAGGDSTSTAFGEHKTSHRGTGLDPAETRQYLPGDAIRQIDWNATARRGHPHVREFEAETDLSTAIVIDHRASMGTGVTGETKLDYLRQVALAYTDYARTNAEQISLYTVGDGGVTGTLESESSDSHYARIETKLHDLIPTTDSTDPVRDTETKSSLSGESTYAPRSAQILTNRLRTDDSAFGKTLLPYFATSKRYVQHIKNDPLYKTIRTYLDSVRGSVVTVLLTDDTHQMEVREAIRTARRYSNHVTVFIAPTVLFKDGRLGTIEDTYDNYVEFEEFRRDLTRIDGVTAFEVGPADRIETILSNANQATKKKTRRE